jgi:hypothetical protein
MAMGWGIEIQVPAAGIPVASVVVLRVLVRRVLRGAFRKGDALVMKGSGDSIGNR